MDLSNLIWHLGAFVFALWAATLALGAKKRSQACVEALLPVLFADSHNIPREKLRSASVRIFEFFEQEISNALEVRCTIVRSSLSSFSNGIELRTAAADLWRLLPQAFAERAGPHATDDSPLSGGFEYGGTLQSALLLVENVKGTQKVSKLAFERVQAQSGRAAYWRVSNVSHL